MKANIISLNSGNPTGKFEILGMELEIQPDGISEEVLLALLKRTSGFAITIKLNDLVLKGKVK